MKTYEERTETKRVCVATHCDACKREIKTGGAPMRTRPWRSPWRRPFLASLGVDVAYQED